ncbi:MAG: hypothetical protein HY646_04500 [Acidobacteria bacterium]|nr:hypothetical protein [Acidobacteriota bacterium]
MIERGYDPYGFIRVTDALDSLAGGSSPKPAAIVLELRGQELTNELIESIRNLAVPTFLLGGSAELNQSVIRKHSWDMVVKRPFSLGHLADLIERVVKKDLQKEGQNP